MFTYSDLLKAVKKHKGSFYLPVLIIEDVVHMKITKSEILQRISFQELTEKSDWYVDFVDKGGMWLDVNNH